MPPGVSLNPRAPINPPLARRRYIKARSAEGDDDEAWHTRQWENDKPSWDTDARCTDCGEREPGVVVDIPADAE